MDSNVLRNISYGVYAVTTLDGTKSTGCIANSIMQVTTDTIAVSLNHSNYTNECVKKSGKLAISILSTDCDDNIIPVFGFQSGRDCDKCAQIETINVDGIDVVKNSIGYLTAEVTDSIETSTHTVFLARIKDAKMLENKTPMTYAYYHQVKKGTSPKTAPTYIEEKPSSEGLAYKCKICGYIYQGDITAEPDSYICPICKQPKSVFEKV